ncbi:unnamed protein product [Amoebophrya sp. A120]|nr:unnamed protein product [Amoebophrya sp. A120]|eukprot:GSA120T00004121001.1
MQQLAKVTLSVAALSTAGPFASAELIVFPAPVYQNATAEQDAIAIQNTRRAAPESALQRNEARFGTAEAAECGSCSPCDQAKAGIERDEAVNDCMTGDKVAPCMEVGQLRELRCRQGPFKYGGRNWLQGGWDAVDTVGATYGYCNGDNLATTLFGWTGLVDEQSYTKEEIAPWAKVDDEWVRQWPTNDEGFPTTHLQISYKTEETVKFLPLFCCTGSNKDTDTFREHCKDRTPFLTRWEQDAVKARFQNQDKNYVYVNQLLIAQSVTMRSLMEQTASEWSFEWQWTRGSRCTNFANTDTFKKQWERGTCSDPSGHCWRPTWKSMFNSCLNNPRCYGTVIDLDFHSQAYDLEEAEGSESGQVSGGRGGFDLYKTCDVDFEDLAGQAVGNWMVIVKHKFNKTEVMDPMTILAWETQQKTYEEENLQDLVKSDPLLGGTGTATDEGGSSTTILLVVAACVVLIGGLAVLYCNGFFGGGDGDDDDWYVGGDQDGYGGGYGY